LGERVRACPEAKRRGEGDSKDDSHPLSAFGGIFNLVLPLKGEEMFCMP